jgi:tRNA pseudouridine65 synthase
VELEAMSDELSRELEILFQDDHLIAINKPAGLLVHRSRIDIRADEFAVQRLRDQVGFPVFLVHRLDRPTSGVLLFATGSEIAAGLAGQFERRTVTKIYFAIVRGHAGAGRWDEPLLEKPDAVVDKQVAKNKPAQSAVTQYEQLQAWEIPISAGKYESSRYSLVRVQPKSGRKHQIRRHFNHMAHPIVGDTTYGDRRHNRLFRDHLNCSRLLLVARTLQFNHPVTGDRMTVVTPVGDEFARAIDCLDEQTIRGSATGLHDA